MEPNNSNMNIDGEGGVGPVIALIIILAVIVLGGLYFWGQRTSNNTTDIYGNPISPSVSDSNTIPVIDNQSSSDASASIEADLKATDIDSIDSQLNAL